MHDNRFNFQSFTKQSERVFISQKSRRLFVFYPCLDIWNCCRGNQPYRPLYKIIVMKKVIILLILLVSPASSQFDSNPENWCRNGAFPRDSTEFSLATIKAKKGARVYFYDDAEDCPNGKNCRKKAYLISGNEVVVSRKFGDWACSWYQPKKGAETVGWISLKNLAFTEMVQGIESYAGKWSHYDNSIEIKKTTSQKIFAVTGNAFWKGLGDNIHIGELDGKAVWNEKFLAYGEDDKDQYACKVKFHLIGNYLIVSDNLNCGGVNVTFSGVYQRKLAR